MTKKHSEGKLTCQADINNYICTSCHGMLPYFIKLFNSLTFIILKTTDFLTKLWSMKRKYLLVIKVLWKKYHK